MEQSAGSLETSNQNNSANSQQNKQQEPPKDEPKPASLKDMFQLSDDGSVNLDSTDDSDDDSKPIDSLDRVIKKLGIKPEEAYKIKIPMPDGQEPVTLGHLKDRVGEVVGLEQRELAFDERRRQVEGETLQAQAEMREILQLIPREHLKPELVDKVRKQHEATVTRERSLTRQHIPEWENEETRRSDMEGMIGFLKEYGFSEAFLGTVIDHRSIKFIRDAWRTNQRIRQALGKVTTPERKSHQPSSKGGSKGARKPAAEQPRSQVAPNQRTRIVELFNQSEK